MLKGHRSSPACRGPLAGLRVVTDVAVLTISPKCQQEVKQRDNNPAENHGGG